MRNTEMLAQPSQLGYKTENQHHRLLLLSLVLAGNNFQLFPPAPCRLLPAGSLSLP